MHRLFKMVFFVLTALVSGNTIAQLTIKQQAAQKRAATDSLTKLNYQQLLKSLAIKLPELPPVASDPKRPKNTFLRKGGNGYTDAQGRAYSRNQWGTWVNYDENKANDYVLPNPLVLKNGKKVTSAAIWWRKRRPEIVKDYDSEVFGRVPKKLPAVRFEVTDVDHTAFGGTVIKKTITGLMDNAGYPGANPIINIVVYLPAKTTGAVPLMVIASPDTKGNDQTIELLNKSGWAVALFDTYGLQADNGAGLNHGIIGLAGKGAPRQPEDWGVLRAWSWGLSRALDYFQTDKTINPNRIGIAGHSRWGKTALLAAAMDQRWAIVFASCSGSGGASLEKRNYGENLGIIAGEGEYHWMASNFVKYGGNWQALPVDAHEMIALIAPRPLFITGGTEDLWADPLGEFKACEAATPVYTLLGKTGISATELPAPDVSLIKSDLAFREHEGGHTDAPDWPVFIEFARKYFKN